VIPGGFEDRAHASGGLVEGTIGAPEDRRRAARRLDETEEDAKRGRLAGSVRAEKPGDPSALDGEAEVVDRDRLAEPFREPVDLDDSQARPPSARAMLRDRSARLDVWHVA
jgi:hypothetical protein